MTVKRHRSTTSITPFSFWTTAVTLAYITMLTVIIPTGPTVLVADAAPAKHTPAPNNLINTMSTGISETSALPLQLQIESQTMGKQKLAYLPTAGPSMDFYYLNYRSAYRAGETKIDFWMLTPRGTPAPKTGSLELYDEFGKVRLAVLAPEGTEIPQDTANKNEPFLWKSWAIPKTLESGFDFSERFRVVLKTSDSKSAIAVNNEIKKRADPNFELLVRGNNKHVRAADNADTMISPSDTVVMVAQDRQFRIKGLQATPGGKPNPAKLRVNSVTPTTTGSNSNSSNNSNNVGSTSSNADGGNSNSNTNTNAGTNTPLSNKYNDKTKQSSSASPTYSYITRGKTLATVAAVSAIACFAL
ncbi:hypothetical protein BGX26_002612 [Mortierella sp. AD094]|nr:hypothetical protein BGX26_002612 [Mortierella sp. AD094]